MIPYLPPGFIAAIEATSRKPVMLLHIHLGDETCLLSDSVVGKADGLQYDYTPIVESWGTLLDTSSLDASFRGDSLEVKSTQITLVLTGEDKDKFLTALETGIDNTLLEVYQWFRETPDEAPQLVDTFVAQDPIQFSEASSLFVIDAVSVLMRDNPYLVPREPGEAVYPYVVGKATNIPLINLETDVVTKLSEGIAFDYTGDVFIDNGVGFREGPDKVVINSEIISYSDITASVMTISARGVDSTVARPHISGALVNHSDAVFDYAVSSGPVEEILELEVDGNAYTQTVTFVPDVNPALVRFEGRPPYVNAESAISNPEPADPIDDASYFGNDVSTATTGPGGSSSNASNINAVANLCSMSIYSDTSNPTTYLTFSPDDNYSSGLGIATDTTELQGGTSGPTGSAYILAKANPITGTCDDNEEAYWEWYFDPPIPNTATISSAELTIKFGGFTVAMAEAEAWLHIIDGDGNQTLIEHWIDDTHLTATANNHWGPDYDLEVYDLSSHLTTEQELAEHVIRFTYKNLECQDFGYGGTATDARSRANITYMEYDLVYKPGAVSTADIDVSVFSVFDQDLSSLGTLDSVSANVSFDLVIDDEAYIRQSVIAEVDGTESEIWFRQTTNSPQSTAEVEVDLPSIEDFTELSTTKLGLRLAIQGDSPTGVRDVSCSFDYVEWLITYTPPDTEVPSEIRVIFGKELRCSVIGETGEDPTPARVIEHLLTEASSNAAYVHSESFEERHQEYFVDDYFFNGVMKGDIRLHAAIKQCLYEGLARLVFSEGAISLLNYETYEDTTVDYAISQAEILLRSKSHKNQPTSTIKNYITVQHTYSPADSTYLAIELAEDAASKTKFELQEERGEYTLINDDTIGQKIADYHLARLSIPSSVVSVAMFMSAYRLQKGDLVTFQPLFGTGLSKGHVAAIDRIVGQGKNGIINTFILRIVGIITAVA